MALSVCLLLHLKGWCCSAQQIVAVIVLQTVGLQWGINMIYSHFLWDVWDIRLFTPSECSPLDHLPAVGLLGQRDLSTLCPYLFLLGIFIIRFFLVLRTYRHFLLISPVVPLISLLTYFCLLKHLQFHGIKIYSLLAAPLLYVLYAQTLHVTKRICTVLL